MIHLRRSLSKNRQPARSYSKDNSATLSSGDGTRVRTTDGATRISDYVFHNNGNAISNYRKTWTTACKKAGVPDRYNISSEQDLREAIQKTQAYLAAK